MPAESKSQQMAAAMALRAKRGQMNPRHLKEDARHMWESMTEEELEHMAGTKRKGLPYKK